MSEIAANDGGVYIGSSRDGGETLATLARLEDEIATALVKAADEIAHVECFDDEERSEVYAVLAAIRNDTDVHRSTLETLQQKLAGEAASA